MNNDIFSTQLKIKEFQILCEGASFEWDKKNPWVNRGDGGKFAKSASSSSEVDTGKQDSITRKVIKSMMGKADDIGSSIDKLPEGDRKKIFQALNSPNMQKARIATRAKFDAMGKEAGEAFSAVNAQLSPIFENSGNKFSKAVAKSKKIVKGVIDAAKENPELVVAGAIGALMATIGTGGAIAFFTLPNLFGLGGLYGGIAAIVTQQSVQNVLSAFALGGLSQISFGVSLDLVAGGLITMAGDAAAFGDAVKQQLKK
jgi:hypothetical protein